MTPTKDTSDAVVLARLEQKVDQLTTKVDDMNTKLYGNGHPGIIVDQVLQSEQINNLLTFARTNSEDIGKLKETSTPTWISKNWVKIVLIGTFIVIFVHSVLPEGATIWQLLSLIK